MKHKSNVKNNAPIIVLVRPQLAQNVGMVARAMMNCGLGELRLVNPCMSHLSPEGIATSSGAQSILEDASVYSSLIDALHDVHFVFATTARVRDMTQRVYTPNTACQKINALMTKKNRVALVFGPERTGLENDDLVYANALIRIPLNPNHPSLNLAQAVLLIGWSWWNSKQLDDVALDMGSAKLAAKIEVEHFTDYLFQELDQVDYFHWPEKRKRMEHNIQNMLTRTELTSAEIKTLYRLVHKLVD